MPSQIRKLSVSLTRRQCLVRQQVTAFQIADVDGNRADTVRVVTAQVGRDEVLCDERRLALGRAGGTEDVDDEVVQLGLVDEDVLHRHDKAPVR